ncbi:MAG: hypothetical protein ABSA90_15460, partial [Xanthobacteraceae bacterium]
FTSRNDDAQSSSVVSTDPAIHDPPNHGGPWIQKSKENATVMLSGKKKLLPRATRRVSQDHNSDVHAVGPTF